MKTCRDWTVTSHRYERGRTVPPGQQGFTLVELMVTLVIFGMASLFIYEVFITQHNSYMTQQDVSETQQDVRGSLDLMTRELRSVGYGVPGGGTGITTVTNGASGAPDSITFQVAQGASTFLSADASTSTITVNSTDGFEDNQKVNVLSIMDRSQLGGAMFTITTVSPTTQLILNAAPPAKEGDLVVSADSSAVALQTITYALTPDTANPGTFLLQRNSTSIGMETLADHILDMQLEYTLDGSTTPVDTVDASDLKNIRLIQLTITSQTVKNVAKLGNQPRTRQLTALIRMKNV